MAAGTNFFHRQRQARAASRRLVVLFGVAVAGIVLAICGVFLLVLGVTGTPHGRAPATTLELIANHWGMLLSVALGTLAVIGVTSAVRAAQLRQGGGVIARQLGGTPVATDSRDLRHQRLRNVVEEMAIASGVPVPEIYVLEHEPGINAFAAGFSTSDAAVAVTRGALEQLNRDELQGVIAHEFSHVVNGDMRLNIKLMGLLFGILVLAFIGRILLHVRGGQRNPVPLIGLALLIAADADLRPVVWRFAVLDEDERLRTVLRRHHIHIDRRGHAREHRRNDDPPLSPPKRAGKRRQVDLAVDRFVRRLSVSVSVSVCAMRVANHGDLTPRPCTRSARHRPPHKKTLRLPRR